MAANTGMPVTRRAMVVPDLDELASGEFLITRFALCAWIFES